LTADPLLGQVVQHFRIVREIGRGGMGIVYEAEHERFPEKRAAVKVLPPNTPTEARAQLFREARACMRLSHEGLVETYDCGEISLPTGTTPYILMQLIPGETLRSRLLATSGRGLDVVAAVKVVEQVAAAMAYAHSQGVIHRDLKPGNLMLSASPLMPADWRVKILDFGIAKLMGEQPTQPFERVHGTLNYLPPERLSGQGDPDGRGDVYALGCVLYELLSGTPPFTGADAMVQLNHLKRTPTPLHRRVPGISPALERLVQRMLAKDPAARPTMAVLAERLRQLLADPQALALRPPTVGTRIAKVAVSMLPVLFLLAVGFALWPHIAASFHVGSAYFAADSFRMGTSPASLPALYEMSDRLNGNEVHVYRKNRIFDRELPQRAVRLHAFRLDRHEVRNADFAAWIESIRRVDSQAIEIRTRRDSSDGSVFYEVFLRGTLLSTPYEDRTYGGLTVENGRVEVRKGMENRPVTTVTWQGARRFCMDRGARLPTEAEWEYAATDRGRYRNPWGDEEPDCSHSVVERGKDDRRCIEQSPLLPDVCSSRKDITSDGICDLGGSLSEWVEDLFLPRYPDCEPAGCLSPVVRGATETEHERGFHVLRGGAWSLDFLSTRPTGRRSAYKDPAYTSGEIGFRCAQDAE